MTLWLVLGDSIYRINITWSRHILSSTGSIGGFSSEMIEKRAESNPAKAHDQGRPPPAPKPIKSPSYTRSFQTPTPKSSQESNNSRRDDAYDHNRPNTFPATSQTSPGPTAAMHTSSIARLSSMLRQVIRCCISRAACSTEER
jgi:hypothetical protein